MNITGENIDYADSRGRARIGVVVPVTNTNLEPDMTMMRPSGVSLHFVRAGGYDIDAIPDETQMQNYSDSPWEEVVDHLKLCKSNIILYGCTSATLAQGPEFDAEFRHKIEARTGIPTITAASALIEALTDLGLKRFAFSSPYVVSLSNYAIAFIESFGLQCVSRHDSSQPLSNDAVAEITPAEVIEMARKADSDDADVIVLSCTDMRSTEAIDDIEAALGKPVVTSNQAMMHASLKLLSIPQQDSSIARHALSRHFLNRGP